MGVNIKGSITFERERAYFFGIETNSHQKKVYAYDLEKESYIWKSNTLSISASYNFKITVRPHEFIFNGDTRTLYRVEKKTGKLLLQYDFGFSTEDNHEFNEQYKKIPQMSSTHPATHVGGSLYTVYQFDLKNNNYYGKVNLILPIAQANSDQLNLDYYSVTINSLPKGMSMQDFFQYVRVNFGSLGSKGN